MANTCRPGPAEKRIAEIPRAVLDNIAEAFISNSKATINRWKGSGADINLVKQNLRKLEEGVLAEFRAD
jgi:hypothetical protein